MEPIKPPGEVPPQPVQPEAPTVATVAPTAEPAVPASPQAEVSVPQVFQGVTPDTSVASVNPAIPPVQPQARTALTEHQGPPVINSSPDISPVAGTAQPTISSTPTSKDTGIPGEPVSTETPAISGLPRPPEAKPGLLASSDPDRTIQVSAQTRRSIGDRFAGFMKTKFAIAAGK